MLNFVSNIMGISMIDTRRNVIVRLDKFCLLSLEHFMWISDSFARKEHSNTSNHRFSLAEIFSRITFKSLWDHSNSASKALSRLSEVVDFEKANRVFKILDGVKDGDRTLIFCETKRGTDDLTRNLRRNGWPALSIHGDKFQSERDWFTK